MVFGRLGGFGVRPFRTITPISMEATKSKKAPAANEAATGSNGKNHPVIRFTEGDVSAAVWPRTVVKLEPVTYYSISLERSYQNAKSEWKHTNFYNPTDKKKIDAVWEQAEEYIENCRKQEAVR